MAAKNKYLVFAYKGSVGGIVVVFVMVYDCDGERANNLSGHEPSSLKTYNMCYP